MLGLKQLVEEFASMKIGEQRSYKQIEAIIGKNPQAEGRSIIERAVKKLRRPPYGIAILNQRNVGYYRGTLDERVDWISGRRDHVRRTMIEGYVSSAVVEEGELKRASEIQKTKLLNEQSRMGLELMFSMRLEKARRLPPAEKLVPMAAALGELIEKRAKKST